MPDVKHHSRPFAVTEEELTKVESFCVANGLDEIGRVCAELRVLRAEYLSLSNRLGKVANAQPDPYLANRRFSKSMDSMTKGKPESDPNDFPEM